MQWLQSAFSSNSSNSSTKSDSPISKTGTNFKDINYFFRKSKPSRRVTRRLTRQRKLRHLTDIDVGHLPLNNFVRFAENLESPSDLNISSSPAVPQPLPLPDSFLFCRDSPSTSSHSAHPLPSPHEVRSRAQSEDNRTTESIDGDEIEDGLTFNGIGIGRSSTYHTNHKSADNVDTLSEKSPIGRGKKVLKDRNGFGNVQNNFRLIASAAASAPASGIPSPTYSPRRNSTGEAFPSPYLTAQGFIWSAPEFAAMDIMDLSSQAPSDKTWSPHHAPGLTYKSASATTSPLHPRSPASTSRHESNGQANVHRLPLPPGPAVSSQTVATHQTITKPDVPMMTSQWQKGKLIGRGTFGSVYVATNRETGALCAMKEVDLIPDDSKSAECMKQLEQEIKVLSQLKHPNIVQYYGSEIVGDHFYIYLEYVHPGSINKYVRDHYGAITESVVRNFTRHILYGLAYLHSTKTVHRDIKGANLLVDASGVVKLADFGMAKHFSGQASELSMKGSPYWMAPEIIHAVNKKDANGDFAFAVDIWSLGCTIIEIVNGKPPWSEYEGAAAMFKVWKETPPIPKSLSPLGKDFLQCCFRRNPAERPSASKLLEHPFVKNSIQTDIQACTQSFAAMKLG